MKKIFKKALVLFFVVTLFTTPVIAHAATIIRVEDYGGTKFFYYDPYDMLIVNSGDTASLNNNENGGAWYFEAGANMNINVSLIMNCSFELVFFNMNTGTAVATASYDDDSYVGATYTAPTSGNYAIILKPRNSTAAIVEYYCVGGYSAAPSNTTQPRIGINEDGVKLFSYDIPLVIPYDTTVSLIDLTNSDGYWNAPAGKKLRVDLGIDGYYCVRIIRARDRVLISEEYNGGEAGYVYDIPESPIDERYEVTVTALSPDVVLRFYGEYIL